ncbi:TLC domain-containing protein 3A-like isoform X2 [Dreissena polymorpha]|uniref:TLC domain-containing protein n=2 Tax=Dreissena polymorpha TaxID=45954 RepID=A0A9D4MYU7_DREPO|nr:TLC domain-containing protein 3A-like isoform X2 [Dreissena polymorpha]KAH3884244.1 hypothetical protein DPMN_008221 [Dreissena polymorpha]
MADISPITKSYACFGLPYFLYDIWAIYNTHYYINEEVLQSKSRHSRRIHFIRKNIAMLVHHIVLPFIFFPIIMFLRNDKGDYFVGLFYMCEAAVPFISLRFVLAQLNQKHTAAYIFTGVMMIVVFFIVRVCIFPFLYWKYSDFSGIPLSSVPFHIPLKCNAGCLVFLVVQVYFLYIMVHGAVKFFYKIFVLKSKGR